MPFCAKCGAALDQKYRFCNACGESQPVPSVSGVTGRACKVGHGGSASSLRVHPLWGLAPALMVYMGRSHVRFVSDVDKIHSYSLSEFTSQMSEFLGYGEIDGILRALTAASAGLLGVSIALAALFVFHHFRQWNGFVPSVMGLAALGAILVLIASSAISQLSARFIEEVGEGLIVGPARELLLLAVFAAALVSWLSRPPDAPAD